MGNFLASLTGSKEAGAATDAVAAAAPAAAAAKASAKPSVMFVCVHNAARSQMAEGYGKEILLKQGLVSSVQSAGLEPTQVNEKAIAAMSDVGLDITGQTSKHLDTFASKDFPIVISLCGCGGTLPEDWTDAATTRFEDWDLKDPEGNGDDVFKEIRDQVKSKMEELAASLR
jgi:arsenate reductase